MTDGPADCVIRTEHPPRKPLCEYPPYRGLRASLSLYVADFGPFIDGNGRTGRLLLNLILTRLGWPPIVIFKAQRSRYLKALGRADHDDLGPLAEIIARSVVDNLHRLIPNSAGPAKYVPLEALTDEGFSLAALKQAAGRGRLEAIIGADGRYRSSRAAVEAYKASKYSRGGRA